MFRPFLTLVLALFTLSTSSLLALGALPSGVNPLTELIATEDVCATCWQGIEPGVTTVEEAVVKLENNRWVGGVYSTMSTVEWAWSGAQPAALDTQSAFFQGRFEIMTDEAGVERVGALAMRTQVPFGDLWNQLGQPDQLVLMRPAHEPGLRWVQMAVYAERDLYALTFLDCDLSPAEFWRAPVDLSFGQPTLPYEIAAKWIDAAPADVFSQPNPACESL